MQSLGNLFLTKAMTAEHLAEGQTVFAGKKRPKPRIR
jgi:hypothetical protein